MDNDEPVRPEILEDVFGSDQPKDLPSSHPRVKDRRRKGSSWVTSEGKLHIIPHWLGRRLGIPEDFQVVDPRFASYWHNYLIQSGLAVVAMLAILLFVDSLADAALAAGLGSSVVIIFIHPNGEAARFRSLLGGHAFGVLVGGCALLLISSPLGVFLDEIRVLFDLTLSVAVGVLILVMAITDTEHPPAAGTVLGVAMQPWDPLRIAIIVASVMLLALLKWILRVYLRDLI